MKAGSENRRKTIMAGSLGAVALVCIFVAYNSLFGGTPNPAATQPAPAVAPAAKPSPAVVATASTSTSTPAKGGLPGNNAPGVAATKMATTSASLDPTLDEKAMLRTENLVYSGVGRNIFSLVYTPPAPKIEAPKAPARPVVTGPVVPPPLPPPPPPPPINLKFFGTAKRPNGSAQAFLLQGDDVYLASEGDIVARKYKIVSITAASIQVTDLQNNNTQTLPLQQ